MGEYLSAMKGAPYRDQVFDYIEAEDTSRPLAWELDQLGAPVSGPSRYFTRIPALRRSAASSSGFAVTRLRAMLSPGGRKTVL
jgi:hypothetical protein